MKHLKPIAAILSLVVLFAGCDSLLDTEPKQAISEQAALSSSSNIEAVLAGAYDAIGEYDVYGGQYYMLPDLMGVGQDMVWSGTFEQPGAIYQHNILVDNSFVRDGWLYGYEAINTTNNVLASLDKVVEADRDRVEGESRFIRAIVYFQLVRLFAKDYNDGNPSQNPGVPLVLEPTRSIGPDSYVSRNTVEEVYNQVITDLTQARDLLEPEGKNGIRANTYAASAFLARVYLQQGDYEKARDAANRVISSDEYSLVSNFADAFNNSNVNTSEDIFAIQVTNQDGVNSLHEFYAAQQYGGRGDIEIQQQHLDRYESGDARLDFFYADPSTGETRTGKWRNQYGNINVVRLAEMYLVRAEANQRLGTSVGATPLEDINTIRNRAELDDLISVDLDAILHERYIELAFEGHFLFDLKRLKGSVGSIQWDSPKLVYPIPQREMDVNENLTQNDGY